MGNEDKLNLNQPIKHKDNTDSCVNMIKCEIKYDMMMKYDTFSGNMPNEERDYSENEFQFCEFFIQKNTKDEN